MKLEIPTLKAFWLSAPATLRAISHDFIFLKSWTGTRHQITKVESMVWHFFQRAQTIQEAYQVFAQDYFWTQADLDLLEPALERLKQLGLIHNFSTLHAYWKTEATLPKINECKLETLVIPTCNRPQALNTSLCAWGAYGKKWGRSFHFIIGDDSNLESAKSNRSIIFEQRKSGLVITYFGRKKRQRFSEELASRAQVDPAICNFALFGIEGQASCGGNRNSLMLSCVDQVFLSVDDDMIPAFYGDKKNDSILELKDNHASMRSTFYPDRESLLSAVLFEENHDVIKSMEAFLGQSPQSLSLDVGKELQLENAHTTTLARYLRPQAKVSFVMASTAGDDYVRYPRMMDAFLTTTKNWSTKVQHREVLLQFPNDTLMPSSFCITGFIGLDARKRLASFFPTLRGEDSLFGLTECITNRASFGLNLSWAIYHSPVDARPDYADLKTEILKWNPWDEPWCFFKLALLAVQGHASIPTSHYALGSSLVHLAKLPCPDFSQIMEEAFLNELGEIMVLLDNEFKKPSTDAFKKECLSLAMDRLNQLAREPMTWLTVEIKKLKGAEAFAWSKECLENYGKLLMAWPDLWSAASALKKSGWTRRLLESEDD